MPLSGIETVPFWGRFSAKDWEFESKTAGGFSLKLPAQTISLARLSTEGHLRVIRATPNERSVT